MLYQPLSVCQPSEGQNPALKLDKLVSNPSRVGANFENSWLEHVLGASVINGMEYGSLQITHLSK
jgi:hypothetical protein